MLKSRFSDRDLFDDSMDVLADHTWERFVLQVAAAPTIDDVTISIDKHDMQHAKLCKCRKAVQTTPPPATPNPLCQPMHEGLSESNLTDHEHSIDTCESQHIVAQV